MKRLLPLLLATLCVSCHDDLHLPESNLSRVVIVYMMGENSLSSYAQTDLNEIRSATSLIPDDGAMVVYFDNSQSKPQIFLYDNKLGERTLFEYSEDVISSDSTTMLNALRYIIEKEDADEYALILWSHGSGWVPSSYGVKSLTIGIDNGNNSVSNTGTEMEIHTLRGVLENVGVRWRYILFDACFMQCVEVAYELRNLTEWCIGMPAETPAEGADYYRLMPYFFSKETFAGDITEQYYNTYSDNDGMLISAVRCDQLEQLARATANCLSRLSDFPTDGIQQYCVYANATSWKPEYYDMGSCIYHWAGEDAYNEWQQSMETAIPYRYYSDRWRTTYTFAFNPVMQDAEHYTGVSMYVPVEGRDTYNAAWRTYEWYGAVGHLFDK